MSGNDAGARAMDTISREASITQPTVQQIDSSSSRDKFIQDQALQRLSVAKSSPAKWAGKRPSDKVKMLVSGGIYGVYDVVINGAGTFGANGVYEPGQPYN